MDISLHAALQKGRGVDLKKKKDIEETAMKFEKLFARQLVQEMTKDLFKKDDNKPLMSAGSDIYRDNIVNTLSEQLAQQRKLGMADMIERYMTSKNGE